MDNSKHKLAQEIANTLNDQDGLAVFKIFVEKYSEAYLREKLNKTMAIPENKVRKSRGAIFTYLVQQHDKINSWD